jgi:hypothetical protein
MHYVEAKAHSKKKEKQLHHIEIHGTEHADGHLIQHHFEDGSIEQHEFAHPAENEAALMHLAEHLQMQPASEGEENA